MIFLGMVLHIEHDLNSGKSTEEIFLNSVIISDIGTFLYPYLIMYDGWSWHLTEIENPIRQLGPEDETKVFILK